MRNVICTEPILKRLHGRVFVITTYRDACIELKSIVVGRLLLYMRHKNPGDLVKSSLNVKSFVESLHTRKNVSYIIVGSWSFRFHHYVFHWFPNSILQHIFLNCLGHPHHVHYRLNGRHIVEVLRAVIIPSLHGKEKLNDARQVATTNAIELDKDIWCTEWP